MSAGLRNIVIRFTSDTKDLDKATGKFESFANKASVALIGAGVALEGFARSQQENNISLGRLSTTTGIQADALRDLVGETSNVTFATEDVIGTFEVLSKQGLETEQDLQRVANVWDMVADATGENVVSLSESAIALRALGISANQPEEALDALGFITQNTSSSVEEFLSFVERTGPQLREMGLDVNDTAAIMGVLETELGMTGRTARSEFRKAVNEAEGDLGVLLETLGVSSESFDSMRNSVEGSGEAIEENARLFEESFTPLQRLQHSVEEMMFKYGGLAEAAGMLAPIMIGLGGAIKVVTIATKMFNLTLLANPITWIVLAVLALIVVIWLLVKNWDKVSEALGKAWDWIKEKAETVWNGIRDFFVEIWDTITGFVGTAIETIKDIFLNFHPLGIIIDNWEPIWEFITNLWDDIMGFIGRLPERISSAASGMWDGIKEAFRAALNWIIDKWNGLSFSVPSVDLGPLGSFGGFTLSTPNIPRFHSGGVFRAPFGKTEGLALLRDGERILTPDQREKPSVFEGNLYLDSGELLGLVRGEIREANRNLKRRAVSRAGAF